MKYTYAVVRPPGKNYLNALSSSNQGKYIDLEKVRFQHDAYCDALESLKLTVIKLPPDNSFPDGCYVEDPCCILGNVALITQLSAPSRRGEGTNIAQVISKFKKVLTMNSPGTMDGGDVMVTPKAIFIGNSSRTNGEGISQYEQSLKKSVIVVPVTKCLHLKTGATFIGKRTLLLSNNIDSSFFKGFRIVHVPIEELCGANCLNVNGNVLMPKKCPYLKQQLHTIGFETTELDISEFEKTDGGLTCLSLLF